jgi:hypothetical protein
MWTLAISISTVSCSLHESTTSKPLPSSATAWFTVGLCLLAYILSFVDRQIIALLIEPIRADLEISDTQFSLLTGFAFAIFYALMVSRRRYVDWRATSGSSFSRVWR